jgi:hypothetical protein
MTQRFTDCHLLITPQDAPGVVPGFRLIVRAEREGQPLHLFVYQRELVDQNASTTDSRYQDFYVGVCSSVDYQELVVGGPAEGQEEVQGAKYRFHEIDIHLSSAAEREIVTERIIQRVRELVRAHKMYELNPPGPTRDVEID